MTSDQVHPQGLVWGLGPTFPMALVYIHMYLGLSDRVVVPQAHERYPMHWLRRFKYVVLKLHNSCRNFHPYGSYTPATPFLQYLHGVYAYPYQTNLPRPITICCLLTNHQFLPQDGPQALPHIFPWHHTKRRRAMSLLVVAYPCFTQWRLFLQESKSHTNLKSTSSSSRALQQVQVCFSPSSTRRYLRSRLQD